jgi:two-component system OmpR family sensor kinase
MMPGTTASSRRAPLSLRTRLVIGILALLALVIVVVAAASGIALRGFLVGQVDSKLGGAVDRVLFALSASGPLDGPEGNGGITIPAQGPGTLGLVMDSTGATVSGLLDEYGSTVALTDAQIAQLVELIEVGQSRAQTISLVDVGQYRVQLRELPNDSGAVLIGLPLAAVEATVTQLWLIAALVGAIAMAGAAALGALVVRIALRPLDRVVATASEVSSLPLDRDAALGIRVPEADADERTEVGRVGASINRMLEHVGDALESRQASEATLRRFVADASHELRTPLASIRGYSELTRRSGEPVPEGVAHSLGRIESESVRMTGLVEDLLLLARLDEASPVQSVPVDLVEVLVTAVSDAQVADDDHEWEVEVPDAAVVVMGDAARLHQVAMNLLGNARRHTPAGTKVVGRVVVDGTRAVLEVEDDGPGIEPGLVPTVFGRFVRGDASRARATGSTGLGLAIVEAVTLAHAGSVAVDSVPGRTVFRIGLPLESTGSTIPSSTG